MYHRTFRARPVWVVVLIYLLAACAPTPPAPTAIPSVATRLPQATLQPTQALAPTEESRPLTARNCLARGPFPPLLPNVRYGINLFLFGTDAERVLSLAQRGNFSWVRHQIHWKDLEGERGRYTWATLDRAVEEISSRGFKLMLSVVQSPRWATTSGRGGLPDDPAPFGHFMQTLAERYRGHVAAYEIWNEPNLAIENGGVPATPELYLPVLQAGYRAIKQADPCALVLSAPLAATATGDARVAANDIEFYERLYELNGGAFLKTADAVAVHSGGGPHPPDALWPADAPDQSAFYFRHIERVRDVMQRFNDPRQVWITEVGWAVSQAQGAPQPVTLDQQASYLTETLQLVRSRYPWVATVLVWNLNFSVLGPATDEKSTFGILNPDWSPRPAYVALQHDIDDQERSADQATPKITVVDGGRSLPWYAWNVAASGKMRTRPTLAPDGTLYVTSDPGHLYALAPSGALRWSFDAAGETRDAPSLGSDGTVYVGDNSGTLTALRPDGSIRWSATLPAPARGSAVAFDGAVAIAAGSWVVAFGSDGQELWRVDFKSELSPLVRTGEELLLGTTAGELIKLSNSGKAIWRASVGEAVGKIPAAAPDGGTYLLAGGKRIVAVDSAGRTRWHSDLSAESAAAPLVVSDGVVATARDGTLTLLDANTGQVRWRVSVGSDMVATPAASADRLFVGSDDGRLLVFDFDGELRWQAKLAGMARSQPSVGPDGVVYITTTAGRVYAIESR